MSLAEATAVLPTLRIDDYDPVADVAALNRLADAAAQFSPLVGVEATDKHPWVGRHLAAPQAILADVTRLTHFFGGPAGMTQAVAAWVDSIGYRANVAIAGSVGAAWAMANYYQRNRWNACPIPTASRAVPVEACPPDSLPITLPASLPVAALRLDNATHQRLLRLGIRTVAALQKLPRDSLATRLGSGLLQRLDSLSGVKQESIECFHAGPQFYVETILEVPTDRRETIEELIRRLAEQLCERLRHHGQGALRVLCRLRIVDAPLRTLQLGTFRPTAEPPHLVRLLLGQFEQQIRNRLTIDAMSLQASLVAELRWQQTDLFDQAQVNVRDKTAELIDVLASRLGSDAVLVAESVANPLPELAYDVKPLTGTQLVKQPTPAATSTTALPTTAAEDQSFEGVSAAPSHRDPLRRPLRFFHVPVQLDVLAIYPNGPPIRFRWSGRFETVTHHWGPERIESGWWSGPTQRRDYYRVQTDNGAWLWLYRDLRTRKWYIQGEF